MANRRMLMKFGTSGLYRGRGLDLQLMANHAGHIAGLIKEENVEVIVVSSGAIACGANLPIDKLRGLSEFDRQLYASIGQPILMSAWRTVLPPYGVRIGQILGTYEDFRKAHVVKFLIEAARRQVVTIINYHDVISDQETKQLDCGGDNDMLAAKVAIAVGADTLVLLTDVEGVMKADGGEYVRCPRITDFSPATMALGGLIESTRPSGMVRKLEAAKLACEQGITTWIAPGFDPDVIRDVYLGRDVGTRCELAEESESVA